MKQQINFLENCVKEKVLPKKLLCMNIPMAQDNKRGRAYQSNGKKDETEAISTTYINCARRGASNTGELKELNRSTYVMRSKMEKKVEKRVNTFKKFLLRNMITENYCLLREYRGEADESKENLSKLATREQMRLVNKLVDDFSEKESNIKKAKLDKKMDIIRELNKNCQQKKITMKMKKK